MKSRLILFLFFASLLIHLLAIQFGWAMPEKITKPLLVLLLADYFLLATRGISSSLKKWGLLALFFSWAGDILLMFQGSDAIFFLLGLSAFLIAHIFYIILFHRIRVAEKIKPAIGYVVIVAIYYAALIGLLAPHLGEMKIPVVAYGIVISFMLMLALHLLALSNKSAGRMIFTGALLFVASDSLLAINKFYQPFTSAGVLIMLTYGLAQFCIVQGLVQYLSQKSKIAI